MKPWIVLLSLASQALLAACAAPPNGAGRDFLGNQFPPECADLSDINIPIIEEEDDRVTLWRHGEAAALYGGWSPLHYITIRKSLSPGMKAAVILHEQCHEQMWRLTGSPKWH